MDGKRVERLTAPNGEGTRFSLKVNPRGRGCGVHRVTARVEFRRGVAARTRTLGLARQRCREQVARPRLTG